MQLELLFKKYFFLILIGICFNVGCQEKKYRATDIEIFKNSPVWKIANLIENQDIKNLKNKLEKENIDINYQEKEYGFTLLHWVLSNSDMDNNYYQIAKLLIEHGANPFIKSKDGNYPIYSVTFFNHDNIKKYLKLILESKYAKQLSENEYQNILNETLIIACGRVTHEDLEGVKYLVELGADVNYYNKDSTKTPLSQALIFNNFETAKFLIIEKKVKYNYCLNAFEWDKNDESKLCLIELLNNKEKQLDNFSKQFTDDKNKLKSDLFIIKNYIRNDTLLQKEN